MLHLSVSNIILKGSHVVSVIVIVAEGKYRKLLISYFLLLWVCITHTSVLLSIFIIRKRNAFRHRGYALEEMDRLEPALFKRMFRVDRATFDEVLERIEPHIKHRNQVKAINSSGAPIVLKTRLAVTLRWLAGGSYLDLCFAWGVGTSTFYHRDGVLWPTLEAIDAAFEIGLPVDDPLKLEESARGFDQHSCGILKGCIIAIDGFGVSTQQPYESEVIRPKDYRF